MKSIKTQQPGPHFGSKEANKPCSPTRSDSPTSPEAIAAIAAAAGVARRAAQPQQDEIRKKSNHERAALKAHRDGEEGGWNAVTADEDRNMLRDAAIHLENSGMHESADAVKLALVEHDGARSESRRFLDTRDEEEQRLADAEQRAQQHQSFVN